MLPNNRVNSLPCCLPQQWWWCKVPAILASILTWSTTKPRDGDFAPTSGLLAEDPCIVALHQCTGRVVRVARSSQARWFRAEATNASDRYRQESRSSSVVLQPVLPRKPRLDPWAVPAFSLPCGKKATRKGAQRTKIPAPTKAHQRLDASIEPDFPSGSRRLRWTRDRLNKKAAPRQSHSACAGERRWMDGPAYCTCRLVNLCRDFIKANWFWKLGVFYDFYFPRGEAGWTLA